MNILYKHYCTEEQIITLDLDTGGEVKIFMNNDLFAYYGPANDIEIDFSDDDAKDIFFSVGGSPITVLQIIQWAQANHDYIKAEQEKYEAYEADHIKEVSSPFLTGTI